MYQKSILIAETNKKEKYLMINALKKRKINIKIIDREIKNEKEMKEIISVLKPNIVVTNEFKGWRKNGTDIIKEIQDNNNEFQPKFIITSNLDDVDNLCKKKEITAYFIKKPFDYNWLITIIVNILQNKNNLKYFENYNFSKENIQNTNYFMEDKCKLYMYNAKYRAINHRISEIHELIDVFPKKYKQLFKEYETLMDENSSYELTFMYQYFKNKLN